ncbi:MAG: hypothetical protein COA78_30175 [Blastopirellula sp.]|nr:MAG: hypothetical protein COA78_30175 [Blastopirellula sp.]
MKIRTQIILASLSSVAVLGIVIGTVWYNANASLQKQQSELVISQAVAIGTNTAKQVAATRSVYAKHIVGSLKPNGIKFNQQPESGEAPLPAVFMGHISEKLNSGDDKDAASFVLRSDWNINPKQGIVSEFEQRGWKDLLAQEASADSKHGYKPYYEKGTLEDGSSVIRVMTADRAGVQSCVDCHNKLEQTAEVKKLRGSAPLKQFALGDLMGAVVTTVPTSSAEAMIADLANTQSTVSYWIWSTVACCVLGSLVFSVFIGNRVSKQVTTVANHLGEIAEGDADLTKRLDANHSPELASLCGNFNKFIERIQNLIQQITVNSNKVSHESSGLTKTAGELAAEADQGTKESSIVAASVEELSISMKNIAGSTETVTSNVHSVTSAVEEMTSTIKTIADNAKQGAEVAANATQLTQISNQRIEKLGEAADEIGKVIGTIQDIAEQTNLLALNATIEAARAGDAGKGFAVVATEVKELATQTARSIVDIRSRIEAIQESSNDTVEAISEVGTVIEKIEQISQLISSSVSEQQLAANEISSKIAETASMTQNVSHGVSESAKATNEISASMSKVDQVFGHTSSRAQDAKTACTEMQGVANELEALSSQFKV